MRHSGEAQALHSLAKAMGVHTRYKDGLGKDVDVAPETLVRVCAALGAPIDSPAGAADALKARQAAEQGYRLPPVIVAWDGNMPSVELPAGSHAELHLADGSVQPLTPNPQPLPLGYHGLVVDGATATVIAAPTESYRREGANRSWGLGTQLAALRAKRSRHFGDIRDLEAFCHWVRNHGGDLVTVLPLLPTFNTDDPEPSPYSPVSRLFWSELLLDLGDAHRPTAAPASLDVAAAHAEVQAALANHPLPDPSRLDEELMRYARFRGAQAKLGRNWRDWPWEARSGTISPEQVNANVERFHLIAQTTAKQQLHDLRARLDGIGMRLGLDLAVGVHPDGYDPWSRQSVFCQGMSVGAPPDAGFPSGQDWGFAPVLPEASRREGHRYIAASIGHQASLAGVLRIDHIMAWTRLYWIPHGFSLDQGTYVTYPAEELFAVLTLESHRHRCEVIGENLGTVPPEIFEALPKHRIRGMYLAQFEAPKAEAIEPPTAADVAMIGTHDTPTFAGWIEGEDIDDRVRYKLMKATGVQAERKARGAAVEGLAEKLGADPSEPREFLGMLLEWLGRSDSTLVVPWLEDLWLEGRGVNLPGTPSSVRPNWQRPMSRLLDDIGTDPQIGQLIRRLNDARSHA